MSTTHSVGKRAFVLTDDKGQDWWLLEEATYSSNTFPQTPSWCYGYFGDYAGMVKSIIQWSSVCEGGCLSGAGRNLKPESYIRQWDVAIEDAHVVSGFQLNIEFGEYTRNIPKSSRQEILALLEDASIPYNKETGATYGKVQSAVELLAIKNVLAISHAYVWRIISGVNDMYTVTKHKIPVSTLKIPATNIGKVTGNRSFFFFKLNEKPFFNDGWRAISEVIQEIATMGISLQNAIAVIRKLRVDLASAVEYKGAITALRPKSDQPHKFDEKIFKDETSITFDVSEYPAMAIKDYFLLEKIDKTKLIESHAASILNKENQAMLFIITGKWPDGSKTT